MITITSALKNDKRIIIDILCQSFADDPQINWIVGNKSKRHLLIKRLMAYAFEMSMLNGNIYISSDRKAVSMWRNHRSKKMSLSLILESFKLLISFGIKRLVRLNKMEKQILQNYPTKENFEYLWFIGTAPNYQNKGYASALLNPILEKCKKNKKDVYLETTTEKNIGYYQKKGFDIYNSILIGKNQKITIHLLKTSNVIE